MMVLVPIHPLRVIPVLVPFVSPMMLLVISPKIEYLFTSELSEFPDTVRLDVAV